MLNLERLLAPVSADRPCGDDLAFSSEIDAIVRARQADDPSLEQGAWVTELKEADWKFVGRQCVQLIEKRSKDLQLAVWLAEASVQTAGVPALADSLVLVAMLVIGAVASGIVNAGEPAREVARAARIQAVVDAPEPTVPARSTKAPSTGSQPALAG